MESEELGVSGVHSLRRAFHDAGLPLPPLGSAEERSIEQFDGWSWGTRRIDEFETCYRFDIDAVASELKRNGPLFAVNHAGHGMNSFALNLITCNGPVAFFVQHDWGGAYADRMQEQFEVGQTYARIFELFTLVQRTAEQPRMLVIISHTREIAGIVDLDRIQEDGSFAKSFTRMGPREPGAAEANLFAELAGRSGLAAPTRNTDWRLPRPVVEVEGRNSSGKAAAPGRLARSPFEPTEYRFEYTETGLVLNAWGRAAGQWYLRHQGRWLSVADGNDALTDFPTFVYHVGVVPAHYIDEFDRRRQQGHTLELDGVWFDCKSWYAGESDFETVLPFRGMSSTLRQYNKDHIEVVGWRPWIASLEECDERDASGSEG